MATPESIHAGPCDVDVLAALHEGCFRPSGGEVWDRESIASLLAMPGVFAFIAAERGVDPMGLVIGRVAGGESEILTLGVLPERRRAGCGRMLVEAAARHAGGQGADALHLEVAADSAAALALYEHCGFEAVGRRPGYYRRGSDTVDAVLLRRQLVAAGGESG